MDLNSSFFVMPVSIPLPTTTSTSVKQKSKGMPPGVTETQSDPIVPLVNDLKSIFQCSNIFLLLHSLTKHAKACRWTTGYFRKNQEPILTQTMNW